MAFAHRGRGVEVEGGMLWVGGGMEYLNKVYKFENFLKKIYFICTLTTLHV
jgi:hypothetical protein